MIERSRFNPNPVRRPRGKRSPNAMLADNQVRAIRYLYAKGNWWSYQRLADHFEISKRSIHRIINRESYVDVV
jgi:predicted DNA-binding transcriptional regulator YafY